MGHRSCIVHHRPTTLLGALSRTHAHRCLGHADKKRASSRLSRSPLTYVIILEGRRPGGSIGAISRSIVHLLFLPRDGSILRLFQPILIPHEFDELHDHERPTAGPIDRSLRSTITVSIFETRSGKSINVFAETSVRGQARATGISNEYRTCKSINEFEAHSKVFERLGEPSTNNAPIAADIERSFDPILILLNIHLPVELSIRFIKSNQQKNKTNRRENVVDFKKQISIIARLNFCRLLNERIIIRIIHVSIFLNKLNKPVNYFFQLAILKAIDFYETIHFSFSLSRKSLIHVAVLFRAAVMMSGRRTSFR